MKLPPSFKTKLFFEWQNLRRQIYDLAVSIQRCALKSVQIPDNAILPNSLPDCQEKVEKKKLSQISPFVSSNGVDPGFIYIGREGGGNQNSILNYCNCRRAIEFDLVPDAATKTIKISLEDFGVYRGL